MQDKSQSVQNSGASGNGVSPPSATFGYGQVIPPSNIGQPQPSPTIPPAPVPQPPPISPSPPLQTQAPPPAQPKTEAPKPKQPLVIPWRKIGKIAGIIFLVLLVIAGIAAVVINVLNKQNNQSALGSRFNTVQIPLSDLIGQDGLSLLGTRSLVINGQLRVNNSFVISPSQQPSSASPGQIYYDQNNNQLAYYNGSQFVNVASNDTVVQSVGGLSGSLTLGSGLSSTNGQISNTGVLSIQGQTGAVTFTAGPGIAINGTTISSTGVTSLGAQTGDIQIGPGLSLTNGTLKNSGIIGATGSSGISVVNDGSGNITISNTSAGTGTVQSPGGTAGRIAKFTGVQTIADSLLSESGTTVTVGGNLSVTGNLTLGTALSVGNGGTGATSLTTNGVLVGQGSGAITAVTAAGSGLCLISTAGAPAFSACPGAGGVTSLNGLTGALSIANASGLGSTITINDASTSQKGIAQFNSTNFSASGGIINTIQDINTTAAPTFGKLTLTSSQATSPMFLVNNTDGLASGNLLDLQLASSSKFAVSPAGALTLSSTINGQTISSTANFTGTLGVTGLASLSGGATVTGTLTANTITPTGSLTVGSTTQSFTLQGSATSTITSTSGANTTTLAFQSPTASVTYRFLTTAAGTYDICTSIGNCSGAGGGVTTAGGTSGTIAVFTGSNSIGNSLLSQAAGTVTVNGNINLVTGNQFQINGTQISSANLSNDANLAKLNATQTFTGSNLFKPSLNSVTAFQIQPSASTTPVFNADTTNSRIGIDNAAPTTDLDVGPAALGVSQIVQIRLGDLLLQSQQGAASGVSALTTRGSNGNLTLDGASGSSLYLSPFTTNNNFLAAGGGNVRVGNTTAPSYKLDVAGSVNVTSGNTYKINGVDICTASGCTAASGSGNYIQNGTTVQTNANIAIQSVADASVSLLIKARATQSADYLRITDSLNALIFDVDNFGGVHVTGKLTNDGAVGIGNSASSGEQLRVFAASASTLGLTVNAAATQTADLIELKNSTGEVLTSFGATGQLTLGRIATLGGVQAGSVKFADGTLDNFGATLNTSTLTASRTISLPDEAGTICLRTSTNCGFAASSGSTNYIQNQSAADQTADFRISGTGRANTALQTPLLDTAAAGTLSLGTTNATAIALNKATTVTGNLNQSGGTLSLAGNAASSITTSAGALTLTAAASSTWSTTTGTLTLQGTTGNTIILGSGSITLNTSAAGTITVGDSNTTTVNIGALTNNARTVNVGVGTNGTQTQTVTVGSSGGSSVTTIQGGTGAGAIALTPGTNGGINLTTTGTGNINFATASQFIFQPSTNSTTTFQIKNSSGLNNVFNADTTNARVGINMNNPSETLDVFGNVNIAAISSIKFGGNAVLGNGSLSFTNGGAGTIQSAAAQALNITGHGNSTWSTDAGTLTVQGNSGTTINTPNALGASSAVTIQSGNSTLNTAGNVTIDTGTTSTGTPTVNIGTTNAKAVAIGSTGNSTTVTTSSSTTAFKIQNASSVAQLTLDTTNARLYVGPTAGDTVGTLTIFGNKTNAGDPTGVNGAMYYNSSTQTFRCYQDSIWQNCLGFDSDIARRYPYVTEDFMSGKNTAAAAYSAWVQGSTGAGTMADAAGEANHPGIIRFTSSTTANSGWRVLTEQAVNPINILLAGGESFETVLRPITTTNTTTRTGYLNATTSTAPSNGVYFEISGTTLSGKVTNNSVTTTTATTFTVTASTWYRVKAVINSAGSVSSFFVYNDSGTQLWTDTVTATVPNIAGRETGEGTISTNSGTTAVDLIDLDYMAMWWPKLTR